MHKAAVERLMSAGRGAGRFEGVWRIALVSFRE